MPIEHVVHIIDDDGGARDALAFLLTTDGFTVRAFESAQLFLDAILSAKPDCVITDVRMPEITGLELLRRLRIRGIACPVIVITGQADVPVAIEAIKLGAADFIEKPYEAEVLLGAVRSALDGEADGTRDAQKARLQQKLATLTAIEQQVLRGLVDGHPNKAIASDLGLKSHTIEIHRASVMTKMQSASLSQLVRMTLLAAT
jgi:two-component system, LuxR family, response regulator FixJ